MILFVIFDDLLMVWEMVFDGCWWSFLMMFDGLEAAIAQALENGIVLFCSEKEINAIKRTFRRGFSGAF